jgi:hypothetical protein
MRDAQLARGTLGSASPPFLFRDASSLTPSFLGEQLASVFGREYLDLRYFTLPYLLPMSPSNTVNEQRNTSYQSPECLAASRPARELCVIRGGQAGRGSHSGRPRRNKRSWECTLGALSAEYERDASLQGLVNHEGSWPDCKYYCIRRYTLGRKELKARCGATLPGRIASTHF